MTAIPFNSETGQVIGLDLKPASDGSGNYVPVVAIQNAADITIAGFTLPDLEAQIGPGTPPAKMLVGGLIYNAEAPVVVSGQTVALQGDSAGNLKVSVENSELTVGPISQEGTWTVGLDGSLPAGTNSIGAVTANAGDNLNTSALALEHGGNLATLAGTVSAGKVEVDPSGVTSPVSLASLPALATGSATIGAVNQGIAGSSAWKVDPSGVTSPVSLVSLPELPAGTNTIGAVNQGTAGSSAWKVDPSGVTSPVSLASLPELPAGTNTIGKVILPDVEANLTAGAAPSKMVVAGLVYNSTEPELTAGQTIGLQGDEAGRLLTNTIGVVTVNAGTNTSTAALALETGGNLAALAGTIAAGKLKVDPSGVTSPVSLASLPALAAGTNQVGFVGPSGSNGVDYSTNAPSLSGLTLLTTIPANTARLGYIIQNQSTSVLTVVLDDQAGSLTPTNIALAGAAASGGQGASVDMGGLPHSGRIRVYSTSSSVQMAARAW